MELHIYLHAKKNMYMEGENICTYILKICIQRATNIYIYTYKTNMYIEGDKCIHNMYIEGDKYMRAPNISWATNTY